MAQMTKKVLKDICKELNLYTTPEINDILYLHFKGFQKIENLEEYTGLKVAYLEGNGLCSMRGLEAQTQMKSLYLQENSITKIEGLDHMKELVSLNLSQNSIERIENLGGLDKLSTLLLPKNCLKDVDAVRGVLECPSLSVLDIQNNKIDDESILDVLEQMPNLKVVYFKGNGFIKNVRNYRKTVIHRLKHLTYLDDRPVFPEERKLVEAWAAGGKDAEKAERERQRQEKAEKEKRNFEAFDKMVADAKREARAKKQAALADEGAGGAVVQEESAEEEEEKMPPLVNLRPEEPKKKTGGSLIEVVDDDEEEVVDGDTNSDEEEEEEEDAPPPLEDMASELAKEGGVGDILEKLSMGAPVIEEKGSHQTVLEQGTELEATDFDELD